MKKALIGAAVGGRIGKSDSRHVNVKALDDLTFAFESGDRVGIKGHNGSGKTTLLRTLSGVYPPTKGRLEVSGRVTSLLDISTGMDSESTGIENIYLRGILLGLSPKEIKSGLEEIIDFSGLGEFLNVPIRTYSSGMLLRLAFSVASVTKPDILLMDEWLSVGDHEFNTKVQKKLDDMVKDAAVLVIASHSDDVINRLCNKVYRLEKGKFAEIPS